MKDETGAVIVAQT